MYWIQPLKLFSAIIRNQRQHHEKTRNDPSCRSQPLKSCDRWMGFCW